MQQAAVQRSLFVGRAGALRLYGSTRLSSQNATRALSAAAAPSQSEDLLPYVIKAEELAFDKFFKDHLDPLKISIPKLQASTSKGRQFGVGARYAQALYAASKKENAVEQVKNELAGIYKLVSDNPKLESVLADPTISKPIKLGALNAIATKAKLSPIISSFLAVLASNGRLNQTKSVVASFYKLLNAERGEVEIFVTSAWPLDDKSRSVLSGGLKDVLGGSPFTIHFKENEDILAGLIIDVGNQRCDLSVATELEKLKRWLEDTV